MLLKTVFIIIAAVTFIYTEGKAQHYIAASQNSRILVLGYNEGKSSAFDTILNNGLKAKKRKIVRLNFRFDTYDLIKKEKVFSFRVSVVSKTRLDTIIVSPDGRDLLLIFGFRNVVCDTRSGEIIGDYDQLRHNNMMSRSQKKLFSNEKTLAFSNRDNQYVVATDTKLLAFNSLNGEEIFEYSGVPFYSKINELYFTSDDKFLILKDHKGYIYIWKTGKRDLLKKMLGNEVAYSPIKKTITILRKNNNAVTVYYYALPSFKRLNRFSSVRESRTIILNSKKINSKRTSISANGTYTMLVFNNEKQEGLYFYSSSDSKHIMDMLYNFTENTLQTENQKINTTIIPKFQTEYKWLNDSMILLPISNSQYAMINVSSCRYVENFDFIFEFNKLEYEITLSKQIEDRIFSSDNRLVVLPYQNFFNRGIYIKPTTINQPKSFLNDVEFVSFTNDSKLILLKDRQGKIGYISSSMVAADFGDVPLNIKYFTDTISTITEIRLNEKGTTSDDYSFTRMLESKPISELRNDLHIKLKTVVENDSFIEIQIHLIDDNGVYYFGAGSEEWKKLWCNLIIIRPDGTQLQADDFQIVEYSKNDSLTNAISVVLDHSGSMGDDRAKILQKGTINFVNSKDIADALALIKFDQSIRIESLLKKNKEELLKYFKINGLYGMGGGTALVDAISAGISTIKDTRNFDQKSVIVFTDGNENSSLVTKREMILRALENKVKINTIGYGDYISEDYLKAIADYTGGSYFNLNDASQFDWIFEDVYNKNRNYYGIRIKPLIEGEYRFFVKICPPNNESDTLMIGYNYQPDLINKINSDENYTFSPLIKKLYVTEFDSSGIKFNDIQNFEKIKIGEIFSPDTLVMVDEKVDLSVIENEFENLVFPEIKFVFDKTDIIDGTDKELINVINFMNKYPEIILEISGHTDEKGSIEYNQKLSEKRAEKVKQIMVNFGISPVRLKTIGFGKSLPVTENKSETGRMINRRVEFRILE